MQALRKGKPSPRIENGILIWYQGDTFVLRLALQLRDCFGLPVALTEQDSLEITVRDLREDVVTVFSFPGEALTEGEVEVSFDGERSALLKAGEYTYDVVLCHGERITLAKNNRMIVEG